MGQHHLTAKGEAFVNNPRRNQDGRIGTDYFRSLILIYLFVENGRYRPHTEFKRFVEALKILKRADRELMNTRRYPIWQHHIDRAKQELLDESMLVKNQDRSFSMNEKKYDVAFREVPNYVAE